MASRSQKKPLYRKVNTRARGVHHRFGGDYRRERRSESPGAFETPKTSMGGKVQRGLDYTPLFRFLLAKVGERWDDVHSEAVARLDRSEPIFWMVARNELEEQDYVRLGESSDFSGLRIDREGLLQKVNAKFDPVAIGYLCSCCTHTFNGKQY